MKQPIIGFHKDEEGDWVADLACGHTRHVRHNPPWMNRPWVTTEEGRRGFIGKRVRCKPCEDEGGATRDGSMEDGEMDGGAMEI